MSLYEPEMSGREKVFLLVLGKITTESQNVDLSLYSNVASFIVKAHKHGVKANYTVGLLGGFLDSILYDCTVASS